MKIDEMIKLMDGHIRQMHLKYPGDNIVGSISRLSDHEITILIYSMIKVISSFIRRLGELPVCTAASCGDVQ